MGSPRTWPPLGDPVERFGRLQAPALDGPWAGDLLDALDPRPGDRLLDVATGSGVLAHQAVERVRPGGTVVGLDRIPAALALAGAAGKAVRWRRGDPSSLPFEDACFEVVACQQGLQLLPDRTGALREMWRVLAPSGRVGVAVWGPIERSPALAALAGSLERHAGLRVAAAVRWLFSLPEPEELRACMAGAGFGAVRVVTARRTVRFASVGEFLRRYVPGSPVGPATIHMAEHDKRKVVADLEAALAPWVDERGLRVATEVNTAVAWR
jgi:ubiquinone/menaquinone biosynthesis C-methylase UbiE